ncbi:ABC transporter permease [Adhaeribacter aquaticus]|uniref:ABC transporter permease n=1 Tax=Adhaeribacter aquaticus TaxID=299567 RepID=UPI00041AFF2C|nr:ABC transporter permease [Adhaeribacter aquaticus]
MLYNYLKIAIRILSRHKGFSFINIAGLAIGLTTCLLISLFVWDEKQFDQEIPEGELIYRIYNKSQGELGGENNMAMVPPVFAPTLRQEFPEIATTARLYNINTKELLEAGNIKLYEEGGVLAEQSFLDIFPLTFKYGNGDQALTDSKSILISTTLSGKLFGTINPVGKTIAINKEAYQVKGVYRNNPKFHLQTSYLLPLAVLEKEISKERMQSWRWQQFYTYTKLKESTNVQPLQAKFQQLVLMRGQAFDKDEKFDLVPYFQPLQNIHLHSSNFKYDIAIRGNITYVKALSIIALSILLIACFNFVNLATAKSLQRAKEVGVRKTIGANRKQLILQFLAETILLTFISTIIAVGLTYLALPWLNQFTDKQINFPILSTPIIALFLMLLSTLVGVLAGIYPAIILSGFKPVKVLKGRFVIADDGVSKNLWLRHSLVVVQFVLSVLLIISALVVYRQVTYLHEKDLGFNQNQIMFFPMRGDNMVKNFEAFKTELKRIPGVSSVSIGYGFPGDLTAGDNIFVPQNGELKNFGVTQLMVDHDYIRTLGIQVISGRDFSKELKTDQDHAFIINETAVKELGFNTPEQALGKPLAWDAWSSDGDSLKKGNIIGVVKDFHYKSLFEKVQPTILQIYPSAYWKVAVKITGQSIGNSVSGVAEVWNKFSPEYPLEYNFLDQNFDQMYRAEDKLKSLLWTFTIVAIFVACLGLFGLAAYAAERRKKEVGIRKILGADIAAIVALLSKDFLKLVLISTVIAFPLAWYAMQQWLQDFAYRIPMPVWSFMAAGLVAVVVAFLTVGYQAVKAAVVNPVNSLRSE